MSDLVSVLARIKTLREKIERTSANDAALGRWQRRAANQKEKNRERATRLDRLAAELKDTDSALHSTRHRVAEAAQLDSLNWLALDLEERLAKTRARIHAAEDVIRKPTHDAPRELLEAVGTRRTAWLDDDKWAVPRDHRGRSSMSLCPLQTRKLYWRLSILRGRAQEDPNRDETQYKPEEFFLVAREFGWSECKTEEAKRHKRVHARSVAWRAHQKALGDIPTGDASR